MPVVQRNTNPRLSAHAEMEGLDRLIVIMANADASLEDSTILDFPQYLQAMSIVNRLEPVYERNGLVYDREYEVSYLRMKTILYYMCYRRRHWEWIYRRYGGDNAMRLDHVQYFDAAGLFAFTCCLCAVTSPR